MKVIQEIYPLLAEPKKVVIIMHQKPDADAMGSSLGLGHFLTRLGHQVTVISPTNWADWLKWMPGCQAVIDYEYSQEKANTFLAAAEWVFCLDFNTLARTRSMASKLRKLPAIKILIDHHQQPESEHFAYGISDTLKSSTSEMIYDLIVGSGHADRVDKDIAACLYAGVMSDTGSFRFPGASAGVHRMVAALKDTGLNHTIIHEELFDNFLENRLRFIGYALQSRMDIFYEHNAALISIPWKDLVRYEIRTGDTEGLVNYPLSIQGIKMAALIIDRDEEIKCSFRSKGGFDVNSFARKYFEGGGHFNAAGGRSNDSLEQTVQRFIAAIKENSSQLQ
ncbi:MAG: DHH family phosphoesterase [Bacteroidota bacterium]|nr:DHH family phosphoesterase [Bacteroidota bacterium]MDP4216106.1 DHH family phosphoesterase [Bacteroidota bacterium]MDP4245542.1 DHH family phosphoesterase [Bacteroidota bacterium]MDP4259734.1 DHH family phosphoesterase [Bacteroidota bacterium]